MNIGTIFGREVTGFLAFLRAGLALIVIFGLPLSEVQSAATYLFIELGILWWTRSQVTPISDPKVPVGTHVRRYIPETGDVV